MATKQIQPSVNRVYWNRQHMKKCEQTANRAQCIGRRARLGNTPRIRDDRIEFTEDLRTYVKSCRPVTRRFEQGAGGRVPGSIRIECIDKNISVDDPRLNGHRRRCLAGGELLRPQDARLAIQAWVERAGSAPPVRL